MLEFLRMGGYAFYVWSSYALTLLLLAGIVVWSAHQFRKVRDHTLRRARQQRRNS